MSQMTTEVELKYRVEGAKHLERLLERLPKPEAAFTQHNHYLDDEAGSLRKAEVMLRARSVSFPPGASRGGNPPVTFTAKTRRSVDNGLFISEERAQVITHDDWRDILESGRPFSVQGPLFRWLRGVTDYGDLQVIGLTVNDRYQIRSDLFLLEIDRTTFPDGSVELEVECETLVPDLARTHIEGLLTEAELPFGPQTEGKYARFLKIIAS